MGERDFFQRYRHSRNYADGQAEKLRRGEPTDIYRGLTGAVWVAEAYEIAAQEARTMAQTSCDRGWIIVVDECKRLAAQIRQEVDPMRYCVHCDGHHSINDLDAGWRCPMERDPVRWSDTRLNSEQT